MPVKFPEMSVVVFLSSPSLPLPEPPPPPPPPSPPPPPPLLALDASCRFHECVSYRTLALADCLSTLPLGTKGDGGVLGVGLTRYDERRRGSLSAWKLGNDCIRLWCYRGWRSRVGAQSSCPVPPNPPVDWAAGETLTS